MPVFKNVLRQIRKIIYKLKRQYGLVMYVGTLTTADTYNLETGAMVRDFNYRKITRGILLPERLAKDFEYDLSFIAANKNFTYGGIFAKGQRSVMIDAKDLASGFLFTTEMRIVINSRPYEIKEHIQAEELNAWLLRIVEVKSADDVVIP